MANDVFANGREISCKSGSGKSICAFPDPCWTPPDKVPPTPLGVVVPYPNTGKASDTTSGSKKVKISKKEVMLKNRSYFKKSMGDEAGCAAKKGFVTSVNRGKVYFIAWSMDVLIEGENVVRHLDMTTHNHASPIGDTPPTVHADTQALDPEDCKKAKKEYEEECTPVDPNKECTESCKEKQKCILVAKKNDKKECCKGHNTGDHLVEAASFANMRPSSRNKKKSKFRWISGCEKYDAEKAACVCVKGHSWHSQEHGINSCFRFVGALNCGPGSIPVSTLAGTAMPEPMTFPRTTTYGEAKKNAAKALGASFPDSNCKEECILAQMKEFDEKNGVNIPDDQPVRAVTNISTLDKIRDRVAKISSEAVQRLEGLISLSASPGAAGV